MNELQSGADFGVTHVKKKQYLCTRNLQGHFMRSNEISYFLSFCIEQYKQKHHLTGEQAIDQITDDQRPITNKIIKDGQIYILRGDKIYTATGAEVK